MGAGSGGGRARMPRAAAASDTAVPLAGFCGWMAMPCRGVGIVCKLLIYRRRQDPGCEEGSHSPAATCATCCVGGFLERGFACLSFVRSCVWESISPFCFDWTPGIINRIGSSSKFYASTTTELSCTSHACGRD